MADLIAGYLQSVGRGLRERPYGGEDERLVEQELLPPMLPVRCVRITRQLGVPGQTLDVALVRPHLGFRV